MYARKLNILFIVAAAFVGWGSPSSAQVYQNSSSQNQRWAVNNSNLHWTQKLASEHRFHDFGVVPSFSKQEHVFEFENILEDPISLIGIRASCGCTTPEILTKEVAPGEMGRVKAKFNTNLFKGEKQATISVSLRRQGRYTEYGELQFQVKGKIRRDVVLKPGVVSFDDATYGGESLRSVKILYAGNPAWRIKEIQSSNPHISVKATEIQRNRQSNRVDYELQIMLAPQQPIGQFSDQLLITTNDVKNKNLAVNIQGNVKAVVQASPVRLGWLCKDQKVEKRLIVRGQRPFGIKSVSCGDDRIQFKPSDGSKTLHILEYRLDTSDLGQISSRITIETDDPDQRFTSVPFEAQIVEATLASGESVDQE